MGSLSAIAAIQVEKALYVLIIIMVPVSLVLCIVDGTKANRERRKLKFARKGYSLPQLVFWNVNSLTRQQPVTKKYLLRRPFVIFQTNVLPDTREFDMQHEQ